MKRRILVASLSALLSLNAFSQDNLKFKEWAQTPPMGWNSWDCFGPTVVESEVKANADYMAKHLLSSGWEYVVVDIRWFVENDKAGGYNQTDPIFVIDEYGRYTPALNRFPSAANGAGFKPLADYVHSLGLKFGIHIMRGLPKVAAEKKLPVLGTNGITCDMIANNDSACTWLRDNYKVDITKPGSQEYYNSIMNMYADWGVDFIKVDDLSRPYHHSEISMIRKAIDQTGRPMILSMSPGETPISEYEHCQNNANMWRTTDDLWDNWTQLQYMFSICAKWAPYIAPGTWPDADMLPLGKLSIRGERGSERFSNLTKDEQITMMSLWTIFKSPLMFGGHMPENDEFTNSLLTNKDVLYMHSNSTNNRQVSKEENQILWSADDTANNDKFAALFNVGGDEFINEKKALYRSGTISYLTTGYGVDVEVDIPADSKVLCLAVSDAGDGYSCDHADWINPTIILEDGSEVNVTSLDILKSSVGWGNLGVNKNINGGTLSVDGKKYAKGFGTHANSIILLPMPEGAKTFKSFVGIDNTGSDQGSYASVEFFVFNEDATTREGIDPAKAAFNSGLVSRKIQKEGVDVKADIKGAEKLYLVVTDAGDNYNYDHANWANPVLVDSKGNQTKLTTMNWTSATSGWASVQKNKNIDGGIMKINGKSYYNGYGVNSNSTIIFDLPEGHDFVSFEAFCGYDSNMETAPDGVTVEFMVFTDDPAPQNAQIMNLDLRAIGIENNQPCVITDMWSGEEKGTFVNDEFATLVNEHGAGLYRISPVSNIAASVKENKRKEDTLKVIPGNDGITVVCSKKEKINIYSLNGKVIYSAEKGKGEHFIKLAKGEYVVNHKVVSVR